MHNAIDHSHTIIQLNGVSYCWGGDEVLADISLDVHKGDYLGIVGPNGGGKTTLLKVMLGLVRPDVGTVRLFDQNIRQFRDWSKIGYVPQKATHVERSFPVTVREVVAMGRYAGRGLGTRLTADDRNAIGKALAQVGMESFGDRLIGKLSGGQQQRVFIARALVADPEVIVLDEPTTGVDADSQEKFYQLLRTLNREERLTLILVSHDIDVVRREATEIATVHHTLDYRKNY